MPEAPEAQPDPTSDILISSTYDQNNRVYRITCVVDGDEFKCSIGDKAYRTQHGVQGICKAMFRHYQMNFMDALMNPGDEKFTDMFQVVERVIGEVCEAAFYRSGTAGAADPVVKAGELRKLIRQMGDNYIVEALL